MAVEARLNCKLKGLDAGCEPVKGSIQTEHDFPYCSSVFLV